MWFTVDEEKPDVGTVIFKADDYYEKLQHITGMWNDNKFLFYEMYSNLKESPFKHETPLSCETAFTVQDITNVPLLMAWLERSGKEGGVSEGILDFMWDMHKLYVKKMAEFGYAINWMSKKEYSLLDNHERWIKLVKAMEELQQANEAEEEAAKKRKRRLKPAIIKYYSRIENLPNRINKKPRRQSEELQKMKSKSKARKYLRAIRNNILPKVGDDGTKKRLKQLKRVQFQREFENPFAWDFGRTRLFDRTHVRLAGSHLEFSRFYHKLSKALRFSKFEPVDWRTITLDEIDKHRYPNDCWLAIKGRVYDVTKFIDVHPGGPMIRQGVGIDATQLFVAVHPYVVFYEALKGKQIGTLPDFQEHYHTEWEPPEYFNIYRTFKEWLFRPRNAISKYQPKTSFDQDETYYVYTVSFPSSLKSEEDDWTMAIVDGFKVTVIKFIDAPYVWYGGFDLRTKVMDDTVYKWFSDDFNTLQLKIAKTFKVHVRRPIKDKRQDNGFFLSSYSLKDMFIASVVLRDKIVEGVKLYGITIGMNKTIGVPVGCYVNLKILDEVRPYTPVCLPDEFHTKHIEEPGDFHTLFFIIKEFKDGDFTSMLHHIPLKKIIEGIDLFVSPAMGNFNTDFLYSDVELMLLIAGGTGISVMTRIIQHYISNKDKLKGLTVCLLLFVQYRDDVMWPHVWDRLRDRYDWFHFYSVLTRVYRYSVEVVAGEIQQIPDKNVSKKDLERIKREQQAKQHVISVLESDPSEPFELFGYPSVRKMNHLFDKIPRAREMEKHKAIICGPYGFNRSCEKMLKEFGKHDEKTMHFFAG